MRIPHKVVLKPTDQTQKTPSVDGSGVFLHSRLTTRTDVLYCTMITWHSLGGLWVPRKLRLTHDGAVAGEASWSNTHPHKTQVPFFPQA